MPSDLWYLEECNYCWTPTWCTNDVDGYPRCRACEVEGFFDNVLLPPLGYQLIGWQRKFLRELYGHCEPDSWRRQFWESYLCVAKKNAKTFVAAGLPIYHLVVEAEREEIFKPLAVSAASNRKQAKELMDTAVEFIRREPELSARFKVVESTKTFVKRNGHGKFEVLSGDGANNDGIKPSLVVEDEFHRWDRPTHVTLDSILSKGMRLAVDSPLMIRLTTGGSEYESPLWDAEHKRALRVIQARMKGENPSPRFYPVVYAADMQRHLKDKEYWKSKEARLAANPSHEDFGGFIKDEKLLAEIDDAIGNPIKENEVQRLILNLTVKTSGIKAIDPHAWAACGVGTKRLSGRSCYAGVDLASVTDLASVSLIFADDDGIDFKSYSWIAEDRVDALAKVCGVNFQAWIASGDLLVCPGPTIRQSQIIEQLRWIAEEFDLLRVGYDPHNAWKFAEELSDEGFDLVPVAQTYPTLSEPAKTFTEWISSGRLRHDNNPLETWCADCLRMKSNGSDLVLPAKPDRRKEAYRIDPIAAAIDATYCLLKAGGEGSDAYARGVQEVG